MLKRQLTEDEFQALPTDLQEDYQEHEADGGKVYRLQVKGMVDEDDVEGLRSALDKERDNAKARKKELDQQKDQFESRLVQMQEENDAQITSLTEQLSANENQSKEQQAKLRETMAGVLRDKAAVDAIAKLHGNPALLLPVLERELETVIDDDGTATVRAKNEKDDDGNPLTAFALVAKYRKDPTYGGAFRGSGSSGSGIISDHSRNVDGGERRYGSVRSLRRSQMTPRGKVDFVKEHGEKAFLALPA